MKTYICIVCGFVYDEAAGRPEDGIAAGTLWADVPASWACPDCGVAKSDFEVVEVGQRGMSQSLIIVGSGQPRGFVPAGAQTSQKMAQAKLLAP